MQFGAYTFVETRRYPRTGEPIDVDKSFADVLEQIELADGVGLDVFGLGEHHRADYAVSAPAVALAAAAARTKRIRLTSAVTVLSSDDPVRVYQQFAPLDLISGGRAEIMAGRGSFIESFPLFGYNLEDYDALFAEKLDLGPRGHLRVGTPIEAIAKILAQHEVFRHDRTLMEMSLATSRRRRPCARSIFWTRSS